MPRPFTLAERDMIALQHRNDHLRVEVKDVGGNWRELTNLNGVDWVNRCSIDEDIDQQTATVQLELARAHGALSLAPLLQASALNNLTGAYSPLLYGARRLRISAAITLPGVAPVAGDWKFLVTGRIDRVGWGQDPVIVDGRDQGSFLLDRWVEQLASYAAVLGTPVQTVMQDIINNYPPLDGAALVVINDPLWNVKQFQQERKRVLEALNDLALQSGHNVRMMFNPATDAYQLALWSPNRAKVVADWTIGPNEYDDIEDLETSDADVRNAIDGQWVDAAGATQRLPAASVNGPSIAEFGRKWMEFGEDAASNIDTQAEMYRMTDAAVSDLGEPPASQAVRVRGFWPVQLGDLGQFSVNGVHYDADQKLAVRGFRHEFANGEWWTTMRTGGKPIAAFRSWLAKAKEGTPVGPITANLVTDSATASQVTMHVDTKAPGSPTNPTVTLVAVYFGATRISGPTAGTVSVSGTAWTFGRPGVTSAMAGIAEFLIELPGYTSQRLYYYIENTPAVLVVTPVPHAGDFQFFYTGTGTITYSIDGGAFSTPPASGFNIPRTGADRTVTFQSIYGGVTVTDTITIPSLEKDTVAPDLDVVPGTPTSTESPFTVTATRADTGAALTFDATCKNCQMRIGATTYGPNVTVSGIASGTVVVGLRPVTTQTEQATLKFKATVPGASSEEQSRTILPQLNLGPSLVVNYTPGGTQYTISYIAVGTITYDIDNTGTFTTPPASPIVVNRNTTDHSYVFKCEKDGQTVTQSVTVLALAGAVPRVSELHVTGLSVAANTISLAWTNENIPAGASLTVQWSLGGNSFGEFAITDITGLASTDTTYVHDDTGSGGHGLDLLIGAPNDKIFYRIKVEYSGSTLAVSDPLTYPINHA